MSPTLLGNFTNLVKKLNRLCKSGVDAEFVRGGSEID
jgi:hypothetical protein